MIDLPVLTRPLYQLRQFSRRLWVRMTLIAVLALVAAFSSTWLGRLVPMRIAEFIKPEAVLRIVEILATSMLTVTTFSLSVMVTARQWISTQSTPRAHRLMLQDGVTQNMLATFLGAFIFALVSLILVTTGLYDGPAVTVILGFTMVVIALVVIAILRWIDYLTDVGGVSQTAARLEEETRQAFRGRADPPFLGGQRLSGSIEPAGKTSVAAPVTGYVKFVDANELNECARAASSEVYVQAEIGSFVAAGATLAYVKGGLDPVRLTDCFVIEEERSFELDPGFGLILLSEIGQRALSPGVNDPGTAIDVIGRILRLFLAAPVETSSGSAACERVHVPALHMGNLCREAFAALARDGADKVEVQVALQHAFAQLGASVHPELREAAATLSAEALARSDSALTLASDRDRARAAAAG